MPAHRLRKRLQASGCVHSVADGRDIHAVIVPYDGTHHNVAAINPDTPIRTSTSFPKHGAVLESSHGVLQIDASANSFRHLPGEVHHQTIADKPFDEAIAFVHNRLCVIVCVYCMCYVIRGVFQRLIAF